MYLSTVIAPATTIRQTCCSKAELHVGLLLACLYWDYKTWLRRQALSKKSELVVKLRSGLLPLSLSISYLAYRSQTIPICLHESG